MAPPAVSPEILSAMKKILKAKGIKPRPLGPGESAEDALSRYLRARNCRSAAAADMYATTIRWRDENMVDDLKAQSGQEALGAASVDTLRQFLPHAQTGCDCVGGPVIFKHMGMHCRIKQAVSEGISLDALARYNIWLNEQYMDALARANAKEWSVVVDAAGWHVGLFDSYAFRFLKRTATTDAAHYPDLLHQMVIVNAPPMLAYAWRVIRNWVDADTREKIDILSESDPETMRKVLRSRFDPSTMPSQYGGSAPPLQNWPTRSGIPPEIPAPVLIEEPPVAPTCGPLPGRSQDVREYDPAAVNLRTATRRSSSKPLKFVAVEIVPS